MKISKVKSRIIIEVQLFFGVMDFDIICMPDSFHPWPILNTKILFFLPGSSSFDDHDGFCGMDSRQFDVENLQFN